MDAEGIKTLAAEITDNMMETCNEDARQNDFTRTDALIAEYTRLSLLGDNPQRQGSYKILLDILIRCKEAAIKYHNTSTINFT